jgi:hypothetical protein
MTIERVEAKLTFLFGQGHLADARRALPPKRPGVPDRSHELMVMNVIKLSEGDLDRLLHFGTRAKAHPEDIFHLASLRELRGRMKPRRKVTQLSKAIRLGGGPVELPDVPRNPSADNDDLMDGLGSAAAFLCSVCRTEYASFDPEVWISERMLNGVRSKRLHVHPRCLAQGSEIARRQGYTWSSVGPGQVAP